MVYLRCGIFSFISIKDGDIAIFNLINRNPINYKSVGTELNTSSRKLVAANFVQRIKQRLQHAPAPVSD